MTGSAAEVVRLPAMTQLIAFAEAATEGSAHAGLVGGITLAILFGLVFALIAFGNGRDHS